MPDIEHKDIPDANLHEPKGAAGASSGEVLQSVGSGATTFAKINTSNIDATSIKNTNEYFLTVTLPDVSAASSVYVPVVVASVFVGATTVLGGAITSADSTVTFVRNDSASFGTGITIAYSGSAAGDVDTFTATTNTSVSANGWVRVTSDGGSSTTQPLYVTLRFTYA